MHLSMEVSSFPWVNLKRFSFRFPLIRLISDATPPCQDSFITFCFLWLPLAEGLRFPECRWHPGGEEPPLDALWAVLPPAVSQLSPWQSTWLLNWKRNTRKIFILSRSWRKISYLRMSRSQSQNEVSLEDHRPHFTDLCYLSSWMTTCLEELPAFCHKVAKWCPWNQAGYGSSPCGSQ